MHTFIYKWTCLCACYRNHIFKYIHKITCTHIHTHTHCSRVSLPPCRHSDAAYHSGAASSKKQLSHPITLIHINSFMYHMNVQGGECSETDRERSPDSHPHHHHPDHTSQSCRARPCLLIHSG